jgi:hypothetical protein
MSVAEATVKAGESADDLFEMLLNALLTGVNSMALATGSGVCPVRDALDGFGVFVVHSVDALAGFGVDVVHSDRLKFFSLSSTSGSTI